MNRQSNSIVGLLRNLNLRHLRGFLEVVDRGTISAAADRLGTSQPALTQAMLKLESEVAHPLFERHPRGLIITCWGLILEARVRAALHHLTEGGRAVTGRQVEPSLRLSMAQIQALLALADGGSFALAAVRLGRSSAAAQRAVRGLEENLCKPLVERRGRMILLSNHGRRLARSCRLALAELEAGFIELGQGMGAPTIAVGTTPLTRAYLVPEAMARMRAEAVDVGFRVHEGSWGELVEQLRDGLIDVLVGEIPKEGSRDLESRALHPTSFVVVSGRQHPLAGKRSVSLDTLAAWPWIVPPANSPLRAVWDTLLQGLDVQAPIECGSVMIIGRMLTTSNLLSLATPDQVALQIRSGLLARVGGPLADEHAIGFTVRRGWRLTTAQSRFLQSLEVVAASIRNKGLQPSLVENIWV